jgi:hypothetical protein
VYCVVPFDVPVRKDYTSAPHKLVAFHDNHKEQTTFLTIQDKGAHYG